MIENNVVHFDPTTVEDEVAIRLAEYGASAAARHGVPELPKTTRYPVGVECSWVKAC